jgi:hypothetical protein
MQATRLPLQVNQDAVSISEKVATMGERRYNG